MKNLVFGVFLESTSSKNSGVYPSQPRYSLLQDIAICGLYESPGLWLRFIVLVPLFVNNISKFPGVSSSHTTYTLLPDTAICGRNEFPALLLRLNVLPKVLPPLVLLLMRISLGAPGVGGKS